MIAHPPQPRWLDRRRDDDAGGLHRLRGHSASAPDRAARRGSTPRLTPTGLSLSALETAAAQLAAPGERQGLVVIRHGELVYEKYWDNAWARAVPEWKNVSFSAGKSWGGTMVGRAVTAGKLSVDDLVSKYHPTAVSGFKPQTTIKHLLTMSSGGTMNMKPSSKRPNSLDDPTPPGPGVEYEWYKQAENGTPPGYGLTMQPGDQYFYDGAPADHLADVISAAVGKSSHRYMLEDIAAPLGCENFRYQPGRRRPQRQRPRRGIDPDLLPRHGAPGSALSE